jgi:deoxycytidine triphosphate deaminase
MDLCHGGWMVAKGTPRKRSSFWISSVKGGTTVTLLRDQELYDRLQTKTIIIENMPAINASTWDDRKSPIQPASVDLRIGGIYIPGTKAGDLGSEGKPRTEYSLKTGHMAIVSTQEKLGLPSNVAAIGFPPSHVSMAGLLMTNPGHVDPGYAGPMRFTVINMGTDPYPLKSGNEIVTLLLFELSDKAHKDWVGRGNGPGVSPTQEDINRLSMDFVEVEKRAQQISKSIVTKAGLVGSTLGAVAGIIAVLIGYWLAGVGEQRDRISELEQAQGLAKFESRLNDQDRRLRVVESATPGEVPLQQPALPAETRKDQ